MILFHNRNGNSWKIETSASDGGLSNMVDLSVAGSNHEAFGYKWVRVFFHKNLGLAIESAIRYIDLVEEKSVRLSQPAQLLRADDV